MKMLTRTILVCLSAAIAFALKDRRQSHRFAPDFPVVAGNLKDVARVAVQRNRAPST